MVNVELLENKSILILKLHRVIITSLGSNVKLIRNFFSLYLAVLAKLFGGLGCKLLGAGGEKGE